MTEGALFAGIMGFGLGFRRAGFENLWAVEKEPFCQAVIRTHFPETELFTDVRDCGKHNLRAVDVLTAGFPCQDLSVAGKRAGLEGSRSGLFWEVVRIVGELRPSWFVLENVPGLFSSCEGRDFAIVLNALDELGYGLAWRVLNSQYFGVAQRRRRVFIVGCLGKPCPEAILFEPESGHGDFAESEEAWEGIASETCDRIASPIRHNDGGSDGGGPRGGSGENLVAVPRSSNYAGDLAPTINASFGKKCGLEDQHIDGGAGMFVPATAYHRIAMPITGHSGWRGEDRDTYIAGTLGSKEGGGRTTDLDGHGAYVSAEIDANGVRDFAELPEGLDSARYRALGNAVTSNVAYWIAERIKQALLTGE